MKVKSKGDHYSRPDDKGKDTYFRHQRQIILNFFTEYTTTMYDAEKQTGICRPSICRYVRMLEDRGLIVRLYQGLCPISGYTAWYFTAEKGGSNEK